MAYAIKKGSDYFDVSTWSGDSSATTQIATSFSPDFVWIKNRSNTGGSGAASHMLYDTVRGVQKELQTNLTDAEGTLSTGLNSFDSDGYKPGTSTRTNATGDTYVGWSWRGSNSSAVTNTDGSITSTVSANSTAGFSIVTYTGTGSVATIGHGLGVAPSFIIVKPTNISGAWKIYHSSLGATQAIEFTTGTSATNSVYWNNTAPTNFVFTAGTAGAINSSGNNHVAYCFAEVEGFSKFGTWETVSVGGTPAAGFVYTGFKPRLIIWKAVDTSNSYTSWGMQDTERTTYNGDSETLHTLWGNSSSAEGTRGNGSSSGALGANGFQIDFLSNGFNIKGGGNSELASSGTYIYMAWAECPMKYATAR